MIVLFVVHFKPGIVNIPSNQEDRTRSLHDHQVIIKLTYELALRLLLSRIILAELCYRKTKHVL